MRSFEDKPTEPSVVTAWVVRAVASAFEGRRANIFLTAAVLRLRRASSGKAGLALAAAG